MDTRLWHDMISDEHLSSSDSFKIPESRMLPLLRNKKSIIQNDSDDEQYFDTGDSFSAFGFEDRCNYDEKKEVKEEKEIKIGHKRTSSLNIEKKKPIIPPLDLSSQNADHYLPSYFANLFEDDKPSKDKIINKKFQKDSNSNQKPTPTSSSNPPYSFVEIEGYNEMLDQNDHNQAYKILKNKIQKESDSKEQGRIYRSAAESNKKRFFNNEAIHLFKKAEEVDPTNYQHYLEHAKLLDEIGEGDEAENILILGIQKANGPISDQLMGKLLKQFERRQKFSEARKALSLVFSNYHGISSQTAGALAEGVLFEVKHGSDVSLALNLLKTIEKKVNLKPGFFIELIETLKRRGYIKLSLQYAEKCVQRFNSMPNNWNILIIFQTTVDNTMKVLRRAKDNLSPSTTSRLEQTAAFSCAKLGQIKRSRSIIAECAAKALNEQRWRILHNAALIELLYNQDSILPSNKTEKYSLISLLFQNIVSKTPKKFYSSLQLSHAKFCEAQNDLEKAKKIYNELVDNPVTNVDWRIFLDYGMFLIRLKHYNEALEVVKKGIILHQNNGRLWALRVQLEFNQLNHDKNSNISKQLNVLREAVKNAPKSGEVWTEAARIALNPLSAYFSLKSAQFFLNTAFLFTPQYIDIFIEMVRLELLQNGMNANLDRIRELFLTGDGNYGTVIYLFRRPGNEFTNIEFEDIVKGVKEDLQKNGKYYQRAIARTSFVVESVKNEQVKLNKSKAESRPYEFAFGLSSFLDNITVDQENTTNNTNNEEIKKFVILGSSGVMI
ncbi:hypothetical protein M9Y10_009082 [Tritrichomonas musculus]|uniref:TPR Domain containing protein n=1 Tax=Tritrichomonas musculus TaxID=1915356 RepID=A0ABR2J0X2_9EUKA